MSSVAGAAEPERAEQLRERLHRLREDIAAAARGRAVTLVAASKRQPLSDMRTLFHLGVRDFGENYPQELARKRAAFVEEGLQVRWHLLGGLQRNKAALVAKSTDVVHSIDHIGQAMALERALTRDDGADDAEAIGAVATEAAAKAVASSGQPRHRRLRFLLQVCFSAEEAAACRSTKRSVSLHPSAVAARALRGRRGVPATAAVALAAKVASCPHLELVGLMVVPEQGQDPGPIFAATRALARSLAGLGLLPACPQLSMGMSRDFGAAIGHGATLVRLGTALFGPRAPSSTPV